MKKPTKSQVKKGLGIALTIASLHPVGRAVRLGLAAKRGYSTFKVAGQAKKVKLITKAKNKPYKPDTGPNWR